MKLFNLKRISFEHGGSLCKGKRKVKRPFNRKRIIHVVLRSSKARGPLSFLRPKNDDYIHSVLYSQAKKHQVKVFEYVNVGNHLHIKAKAYSREGFAAFLISTSALIARFVSGAKKGRAFGKFWDALVYTRILKSKVEELHLQRYFKANHYEAKFGREIRELFLSGAKPG
jgi:hypothetical protein